MAYRLHGGRRLSVRYGGEREGGGVDKEIEPKPYGYEEFRSILSDQVVIRFSVPFRAWKELEESKEWKDFQVLLERHQTE